MRLLSDDIRAKIDGAVKQDPLVVFMKGTPDMPQCGFSRAVIQILQMQDVNPDKVATYNCLDDSELRTAIKEYSDWPTIPQVYLDGEFVGGCDIMFSRALPDANQCISPANWKECCARPVFSRRLRNHRLPSYACALAAPRNDHAKLRLHHAMR